MGIMVRKLGTSVAFAKLHKPSVRNPCVDEQNVLQLRQPFQMQQPIIRDLSAGKSKPFQARQSFQMQQSSICRLVLASESSSSPVSLCK